MARPNAPATSQVREELPDQQVADANPRCLYPPSRKDARRDTSSGKKGSQRTSREVFNRKFAEYDDREYNADADVNPISKELVRSIHEAVRADLYHKEQVEAGKFTFRELKKHRAGAVLRSIRRMLEREFVDLKMAVNHWAADWFLMEVLRRDRTYKSKTNVGSGPQSPQTPDRAVTGAGRGSTPATPPSGSLADTGGEDGDVDRVTPTLVPTDIPLARDSENGHPNQNDTVSSDVTASKATGNPIRRRRKRTRRSRIQTFNDSDSDAEKEDEDVEPVPPATLAKKARRDRQRRLSRT